MQALHFQGDLTDVGSWFMPGGPWEPPSGHGCLKKSYGLDLDSAMLMEETARQ